MLIFIFFTILNNIYNFLYMSRYIFNNIFIQKNFLYRFEYYEGMLGYLVVVRFKGIEGFYGR